MRPTGCPSGRRSPPKRADRLAKNRPRLPRAPAAGRQRDSTLGRSWPRISESTKLPLSARPGPLAGKALVRQHFEPQRRERRQVHRRDDRYRCRWPRGCRRRSIEPSGRDRDCRARGGHRAGGLERFPIGHLALRRISPTRPEPAPTRLVGVSSTLRIGGNLGVKIGKSPRLLGLGQHHLFLDADGHFLDVREERREAVKILRQVTDRTCGRGIRRSPSSRPARRVDALRTRSAAYLARYSFGWAPPSRVVISRWL